MYRITQIQLGSNFQAPNKCYIFGIFGVFGHPTLTQDQYQENASPYSSIFSLGRSIVVETAVPRFGATRPNTLQ